MSITTEQTSLITLSEKAASEIKSLMESQGITNAALRVFVSGGGCSGLQYGMALSEEIEEGDTEITEHGVRLLVDQTSKQYLDGATIEYVDDPMGGGFKIDNPNAVSTCGCGSSFSDAEGGSSCSSGGCCH